MKRLLILLTLCLLLPVPGAWAGRKDIKRDMTALIQEYRYQEGFEVVDLGRVALGLMRAAARVSAETPAEKETLAAFSGITRLVVGNCEESPESVRRSFTTQVRKLLKGTEPLLEVRDQGDLLQIFGTISEAGDEIRDVIIFNVSDGTLICSFGAVPTSFLHRITRNK